METVIFSTLSNPCTRLYRFEKHAVMNIHKNALKIDIRKTSV